MIRFILFIFALVLAIPYANAQETLETPAREAFIMDFDTGQVLLNKNGDERMPTSSMSKVMTSYLAFEALKNGKITLETQFPVSEKAWSTQGSKMFVELGNMIKVEDLLKGVIIQSGNDATIVLAEGLAGTEEAFAAASTRKAKELGMNNTNLINASGWPDDNHYSTARDLAILGQALIKNFPDYYKYYAEKEFTYHDIKQGNRNPLLYKNLGADGIKTGHAEEAGYGLIGSATKDGRRVIMVINGLESMQQRADESARLISWALDAFENVKVFTSMQVVENAPVEFGKATTVPLAVKDDVFLTIPKMSKDSIKVEAIYEKPLVAPIASGKEVGKMIVRVPGQEELEYPLITAGAVEELNFFAKLMAKASKAITGKLGGGKNES